MRWLSGGPQVRATLLASSPNKHTIVLWKPPRSVPPPRVGQPADDGRTRDRVSALLLEHGPQTAAELAAPAGHLARPPSAGTSTRCSPPAGVEERDGPRGAPPRPRPPRPPVPRSPTPAARPFPHAYDDLAADRAALHRRAPAVPTPSRAFAEQQLAGLEARAPAPSSRPQRPAGAPVDRAQALAAALTAEGYAATALGDRRAAGSCASTTARWRTSPPSSRSCARPRPR